MRLAPQQHRGRCPGPGRRRSAGSRACVAASAGASRCGRCRACATPARGGLAAGQGGLREGFGDGSNRNASHSICAVAVAQSAGGTREARRGSIDHNNSIQENHHAQSATHRRLAAVLVASQLTFFAQVPLAQAAMIGTPQALQEQQQQVDRAQLRGMLDNQDVQKKLQEYGVPASRWRRASTASPRPSWRSSASSCSGARRCRRGRHHRAVPGDLHHHRHALRHGHLQLHQVHPLMRVLPGSSPWPYCSPVAPAALLPRRASGCPSASSSRTCPSTRRRTTSAARRRWPRCWCTAAWRPRRRRWCPRSTSPSGAAASSWNWWPRRGRAACWSTRCNPAWMPCWPRWRRATRCW